MYRISTQNIWKVCNLEPNHSKSVKFLRKTIERICNCTPITRNACVSHLVPKHLKSMSFCLKIFEIYLILNQTFEIYWISTQRNSKSLVFVHKSFKKYLYWKTFEKYLISTQNIETVLYAYAKYSKNISFWSKTFDTHQIFLPETYKKSSDIGLIRKALDFV